MPRNRLRLFVVLVFVAFAAWLILIPPVWWLNLTKSVDLSEPVAAGERVIQRYECRKCHYIGGSGALQAPELGGVTRRLDFVSLRSWLRNPQAVKGNTTMPNFRLSDSEIEAIVAFL